MLYVVKRDGREVEFNTDKIRNAIKKASRLRFIEEDLEF